MKHFIQSYNMLCKTIIIKQFWLEKFVEMITIFHEYNMQFLQFM